MSLGDHLNELRKRLFYALGGLAISFIICLFFGPYIISFIREPYSSVMGTAGLEAGLGSLAPTDVFVSYIKISLLAGLIVASPWIFFHLWRFVAAGLYSHEKRYVNFAAPTSAVLFICGALFFILVVAQFTMRFFVDLNRWLGIETTWTFQYYISFVTHLMLVFGLAFQTPTAILFLNKTGLVSLDALKRTRKYVLLGIFIISAIVTPPDVVSQVTLAIPLYALFELGILLSRFGNKAKERDN